MSQQFIEVTAHLVNLASTLVFLTKCPHHRCSEPRNQGDLVLRPAVFEHHVGFLDCQPGEASDRFSEFGIVISRPLERFVQEVRGHLALSTIR